jgi:hypothetical protein
VLPRLAAEHFAEEQSWDRNFESFEIPSMRELSIERVYTLTENCFRFNRSNDRHRDFIKGTIDDIADGR